VDTQREAKKDTSLQNGQHQKAETPKNGQRVKVYAKMYPSQEKGWIQ